MMGSIEEQIIAYAIIFLLGLLAGYKIGFDERKMARKERKNGRV